MEEPMPKVSSVTSLAKQVAELLPAPPRAGHPDLYLAWDELVWSTAHSLAELHASELESYPREETPLLPCAVVSWQTLLALAASTLPSSPRTPLPGSPARSCRGARARSSVRPRRSPGCR